jgi:ketosteroid isomerase-like protein
MSQENVKRVMEAVDAYNRGDLDAMFRSYAPDVEVFPDASMFPEAEPMRGPDAVRAWTEQLATAWVEVRYSTLEAFEVDDGRVVHRGEWGGTGVASGADLTSSISQVTTFRDGLASRIEYFFDHDKALKAVGLEG